MFEPSPTLAVSYPRAALSVPNRRVAPACLGPVQNWPICCCQCFKHSPASREAGVGAESRSRAIIERSVENLLLDVAEFI